MLELNEKVSTLVNKVVEYGRKVYHSHADNGVESQVARACRLRAEYLRLKDAADRLEDAADERRDELAELLDGRDVEELDLPDGKVQFVESSGGGVRNREELCQQLDDDIVEEYFYEYSSNYVRVD